jgi:hypothetical protein
MWGKSYSSAISIAKKKEKDGCGGISIFLCVIEKENKTISCMINIFEVHINPRKYM